MTIESFKKLVRNCYCHALVFLTLPLAGLLTSSCMIELINETEVAEVKSKVFPIKVSSLQLGQKICLKDFDEYILNNRLDYLAFFNGTIFNDEELHVASLSQSHTPLLFADSKLVFFRVNKEGTEFSLFISSIDYSNIMGEFRDPNVSVIRDGQFLMLSTYCVTGNAIDSYYYILDKSLKVQFSKKISSNYIVWGNSLETPSHYILKTAYDKEGYLYILKSDKKITETFDTNFSIIKTIKENAILSEATLGYVNNSILMLVRTGGNSGNETFAYTTNDVEGEIGWSDAIKTGIFLHSPELPTTQRGDNIYLAGGLIESPYKRVPAIGIWESERKVVKTIRVVDDMLTGFGGYPSFVKIKEDNNIYSMMYYDDNNNSSSSAYYIRLIVE